MISFVLHLSVEVSSDVNGAWLQPCLVRTEQERTYQHLFMYAWVTKKPLAAASGGRQWFTGSTMMIVAMYAVSNSTSSRTFRTLHIPVEVMNFRVLHAGKLVIHLV